jgi:molybdate transport system substrate-binding protein
MLALALVAAGACGADGENAGGGEPSTLLVSAAASLSEAIGAVADRFEEVHGIRILLNVAGSQILASQIIEGAPADVFISADVLQMDRAAAAGRIDTTRRVDVLSNQLVIVVPSDRPGTVTGPRSLADQAIRRIAIGDPEAVPAGVYARRYLASQGLWESLEARMVPASSVRAALRAVEAGTVDAGIVYRTDVRTSAGAIVAFAVPLDDSPSIVYPAAVVRDAPNRAGAARFLAYLQSEGARLRFDEAGFIGLPAAGGPSAETAP